MISIFVQDSHYYEILVLQFTVTPATTTAVTTAGVTLAHVTAISQWTGRRRAGSAPGTRWPIPERAPTAHSAKVSCADHNGYKLGLSWYILSRLCCRINNNLPY